MNSTKKVLKSVFGYTSFRENQEEIIGAILQGRDVFTSMPTGGGKSLCYQIPGIILNGLTVVVSPLIALMKDQVDEARSKGISAEFINSTLSEDDSFRIYSDLYNSKVQLLYISPERLALDGYLDKLKEFNVSFIAVDEAHCLSEWGHDFRPDYLFLSKLKDKFPTTPIAAFTATATQKVQDDIIKLLKLKDPYIVRASFNRKELFYHVRNKSEVLSQIANYIKENPDKPGIIYRISRKDVEKTADYLQKKGIKAKHYHAGLTNNERTKNQELFNNDQIQVIVATTAFGMGINKSNIRFVIHGDLPKSMEGYYQETGRAGRDGLDSECILFYSPGDIVKQNFFINQIEDPTEQEKCKKNLNSLVKFATLNVCRRKQILEYFNEPYSQNCGNCDVCNNLTSKIEGTVDAQKILSAILRTNQSFGINYIIDIIRGADTEKIRSRNHHTIKTWGIGKDKDRHWWQGIITELIGQEKIYQDSEKYNILKITPKGEDILYGRDAFYINESTFTGKVNAKSREKLIDSTSGLDKILLQRLKDKRTEIAREKMVPPYIIFSDKTLKDMALLKPTTLDDFLLVSGVGEKKMEEYGPIFIPLITHL
ncbi:MAG: DNA helicase RecQ [Spirochaetales bacterium]|nr:DNA helicase RecQ [Spirochaetales bacterium]